MLAQKSGGSRANINLPLFQDTISARNNILSSMKSEKPAYMCATEKGKSQLLTWLQVVRHISSIRKNLRHHHVISFIGPHNAGKSTMIENLVGVKTNPSILHRTETVNSFRVTDPQSGTRLDVVDFPGATDDRAYIREMCPKLAAMTSLFVVVLFSQQIDQAAVYIVNLAKHLGKPYIVLINKRDNIQAELDTEGDAIKKKHRETLQTPSEQIFYTSGRDFSDVERVRSYIYLTLYPFVHQDPVEEEAVAWGLLHPRQKQELTTVPDANLSELRRAVAALMLDPDTFINKESVSAWLSNRGLADVASGGVWMVEFVTMLTDMAFSEPVLLAVVSYARCMQRRYPQHKPESFETVLEWARVITNLIETLVGMEFPQELVEGVVQEQARRGELDIGVCVDILSSDKKDGYRSSCRPRNHIDQVAALRKQGTVRAVEPPEPLSREQSALVEQLPLEHRKIILLGLLGQAHRPTVVVKVEQPVGYVTMRKAILGMTSQELQSNVRLSVDQEEAVDVAGVMRAAFSQVAQDIIKGACPILRLRDESNVVYLHTDAELPGRLVEEELRVLGRMIGLTITHCDKITFPAMFPAAIFKLLEGASLCIDDLAVIEPTLARTARTFYTMDDKALKECSASFVAPSSGVPVPLKPNGANVPVNQWNRAEYVSKLISHLLGGSLPLKFFALGLADVLKRQYLNLFSPVLLRVLVCGEASIDAEKLLAATIFSVSPKMAGWMRKAVLAMSPEDLTLYLCFVTGLTALPAGGVAQLPHPFRVVPADSRPKTALPTAHTCFCVLELPPYETQEQLITALTTAIRYSGPGSFGLI